MCKNYRECQVVHQKYCKGVFGNAGKHYTSCKKRSARFRRAARKQNHFLCSVTCKSSVENQSVVPHSSSEIVRVSCHLMRVSGRGVYSTSWRCRVLVKYMCSGCDRVNLGSEKSEDMMKLQNSQDGQYVSSLEILLNFYGFDNFDKSWTLT